MAYISEADLLAAGITDPNAIGLITNACRIIDAHVFFPVRAIDESDPYSGFKFPRERNVYLNVPDDEGVVPQNVRLAAIEQVIWMLRNTMEFLQDGGNDFVTASTLGATKTKEAQTTTPLLAPMARLHLRSLMHRVGQME